MCAPARDRSLLPKNDYLPSGADLGDEGYSRGASTRGAK